ncbi:MULTISPECIES: helix-turn-helix domain-containing protein [Mycobacteriaceae]|uniref:helix-turn-helix domain-containing protein n=1 Tax=Mycobacteriaceae TaxID=1762 RepID=UPI00092610AD|nr:MULTISPECIES: helix-turn-helix transcriptional regulator [Mycobacteriaceae]MCX8556190.1 helix-turn-helix transcriptional regulator [Mycolicibacterium mucogenicum]SHU95553.1 Uncharacterised protein [Mycobacteroides abscessus subsp. abscessus]SHU99054.1 Uncharacterised protein [Mycobacteroides abscessus subsp. abscessus]SHV59833.1 Uncharacterised protein [Mycobacteroides abscessus subsp. abscessus]SHV82371.1 Uncharacterised protein [Mycobacteroides abscessus subsp. abscessus]
MSWTKEVAARVRESVPDEVSGTELAARLRITTDELVLLLIGKRPFSSVDLVRLAEGLNVDIDWLVSGEQGLPQRERVFPSLSQEQSERLSKPIGTRELAAALGWLDCLNRQPDGDDIPTRELLDAALAVLDAPVSAAADLFGVSVNQLEHWLSPDGVQPSDLERARIRIVAQVSNQLRHSFTVPGVLAWFTRVHPMLGRTPVDMLTDPANYPKVLATAVAARSMTT